mgnify:CR=1 FL=1
MILCVQNELDLIGFKKSALALKIHQLKNQTKHKRHVPLFTHFLLFFLKA